MPHVTVAIPAFNRAHLIGRTLDSILNQTLQDIDVVVVDDASKDNTVEVVTGYCKRDPRLRLEVNPKNLGLTRNWNHCLELATGPLVQVMQSDDLIDADYLQKVSDIFEAHPLIGLVAASCRYIDENDTVVQPGITLSPRLYPAGDDAVTALLTGGYPHTSSIIMRRACYDEAGKYNEAIWHGPDMELDVRLAARYGFYHFGAIYTSFRRHGSNMGNLDFLREDFLEVDMMKKRMTWGYLSPDGQRKLGINDLNQYLAADAALTALTGAIVTIAYGRSTLTRYYLRQAVRFDHRMWRTPRWWMAAALALVPPLGQRVMERRMGVSATDRTNVTVVESSLKAIK